MATTITVRITGNDDTPKKDYDTISGILDMAMERGDIEGYESVTFTNENGEEQDTEALLDDEDADLSEEG